MIGAQFNCPWIECILTDPSLSLLNWLNCFGSVELVYMFWEPCHGVIILVFFVPNLLLYIFITSIISSKIFLHVLLWCLFISSNKFDLITLMLVYFMPIMATRSKGWTSHSTRTLIIRCTANTIYFLNLKCVESKSRQIALKSSRERPEDWYIEGV